MKPDPVRKVKARFGLGVRRQIFRALVALQDAGVSVPNSYGDICQRYDMTKAELREVEDEGVEHDWLVGDPPLRDFRFSNWRDE